MKDTAMKWLLGLALTAAVTFVVLFTRYTIKDEVAAQMALAGIPPKETITAMQKDIAANTERVQAEARKNEKLDDKIERVVAILLEE